MKDHPTPQRSGRTAEEILEDYFKYSVEIIPDKDIPDCQRQLFDAICSEVIGEDDRIVNEILKFDTGYKMGRNELRAELRQRLMVFFGQDGESNK